VAAAGNPPLLRAATARGFGQAQGAQAPQVPYSMMVRLAGGEDAVVQWDPAEGRYVQVPGAGKE